MILSKLNIYTESRFMSFARLCLPVPLCRLWVKSAAFWHLWVLSSEAHGKWQYWGRERISCLSAAHGFGFLNFMYCDFVLASGKEDAVVRFMCMCLCLCMCVCWIFLWSRVGLSYVVLLLKCSQVFEVTTLGKIMARYSETWYFNYQIQNSSHCSATKPLVLKAYT